jgi:4-hydroxy-3-polyprenylbenzoate decarboxylase
VEIAVAITGASGTILGIRLSEVLMEGHDHQVHLIVSSGAKEVMARELDADVHLPATFCWDADGFGAPFASSSRAPGALVVAPCSMKTLSSIAHGYTSDLIGRVADSMLRLGRPLILMPRETPLSLPAIENMRLAKLAGAIILPPVMAYYTRPKTVDDVTDFFVGKALDALGLHHKLYPRWGE